MNTLLYLGGQSGGIRLPGLSVTVQHFSWVELYITLQVYSCSLSERLQLIPGGMIRESGMGGIY